jgi:hypothetical protein
MKVYVVNKGWDYEGTSLIGVFGDYDKAVNAVSPYITGISPDVFDNYVVWKMPVRLSFDFIEMIEVEVNVSYV